MRLALLWRYGRLKFFQEGSSRKGGRPVVGRSVLNIALISYTLLRYVRNVAREEKNNIGLNHVHKVTLHSTAYETLIQNGRLHFLT